MDRGDRLLGGFVAVVESAEDDAFGVGFGGDDLSVFNRGGNQTHADRGVGLAVREVFARYGEVEGVAVKCLSVDLEWIGGVHINVFG